ncbi:MAG: hypothetical protein COB51_08760 [Moraxellaceae bacterium]|nr:MAG: hypothetical protein COB51_08760 [Moraxellaceae bacterium]
MSQIYITSEAETLTQVLASVYGANGAQDQRQWKSLLLDANPQLSINSVLKPYTLLFIPQTKEELSCSMDQERVRTTWSLLNSKAREVAYESLRRNPPGFMESLNDVLDTYNVYTNTGYVNTFAAGALGGATTRAANFSESIRVLENVLQEYGKAPALEKNALKPKVRSAYDRMNRQFGHDLQLASARQQAKGRLGPLKSSNQGMKRAQSLANTNSNSAIISKSDEALKVMNVVKYGKVVGRGLIVLDVGLRINNVAHSDNKVKTGISEAAGFGAAFAAGTLMYNQCVPAAMLITGPWSLAICLLPAGGAAILADEFGKGAGNIVYNTFAN